MTTYDGKQIVVIQHKKLYIKQLNIIMMVNQKVAKILWQ